MRSKSLNIRVPRLGVNRFGVYYVRSSAPDLATGRRKVAQQSLGTKSPALAKVLALKFCLNLVIEDLMSDWRKYNSNYELDTAKGLVSANGAEDHARQHRQLLDKARTVTEHFRIGKLALGEVFEYLAHDLVARHLLIADREFFASLQPRAQAAPITH